MIIPKLSEAKRILTLHHLLNILLSIAFLLFKNTPLCSLWLEKDECEFHSRERDILIFLAVMILYKGRKATNWMHYVSNAFLFSKFANAVLFIRTDPLIGVLYVLISLIVTVAVPEPMYTGSEQVTYFQGPELFERLSTDRRTAWVIEFYATWSPDCKHVTPVFAELSEQFTLPNLKFGKLDVGRWPKEADRFRVNAHPTSRQLPTICVFKDAKEVVRRPVVNKERHRAVPFIFNRENCIMEFDLMNLHKECKDKLSNKERAALEAAKKDE